MRLNDRGASARVRVLPGGGGRLASGGAGTGGSSAAWPGHSGASSIPAATVVLLASSTSPLRRHLVRYAGASAADARELERDVELDVLDDPSLNTRERLLAEVQRFEASIGPRGPGSEKIQHQGGTRRGLVS